LFEDVANRRESGDVAHANGKASKESLSKHDRESDNYASIGKCL